MSRFITITYLAGVIPKIRSQSLRKMLFRFMRGNIVIQIFNYEVPRLGKSNLKANKDLNFDVKN